MRAVMKKISLGLGILISIISVFYTYCTSVEELRKADMVIFSYNRPLQLFALLESINKYCQGINQIHIIYRTSDDEFENGYRIVKSYFNRVYYHQQGENPEQDFKPLTLHAIFESPSKYIIFSVDDIVVKDHINLSECIDALEKYNAYGFYLRNGQNLTNCYPYGGAPQPLPPLKKESSTIFSWCFDQGVFDWRYPNTVDMTLYRKKDIESDVRCNSYHSPNKLEDVWNMRARSIITKKGLCYQLSKIVNMPLNRVQHDYQNRVMKEWTPQALLKKFLAGKKMDIVPLHRVQNSAAHMEYSPTFVNR